jgi:aminoglycoside 6'-N-acetyltransferase
MTDPAAVNVVSLRPFGPGDRFLVNRWLGEPHVIAWFGSRSSADAELAMAQSSPSSLIRVILLDGAPIGYAQAFDVGVTGGARPAALASGSYEADVFIGAEPHRGKGYGARALALLRSEVFSSTLAIAVGVIVPVRNEIAVRMIERAGFVWREVCHDPLLGPCWVMTTERAR